MANTFGTPTPTPTQPDFAGALNPLVSKTPSLSGAPVPSAPIPMTSPSPTVQPTVVNPQAAQADQQSIYSGLQSTLSGMQTQAQKIQADQLAAQQKSAQETADKAAADKAAQDKSVAEAKVKALSGETSTPSFGLDTGQNPTGETKQVAIGNGSYTVNSNGQIVAGPSNGQYAVGSNISQYPEFYKQVTGQDLTPSGGTGNAADDLSKQMLANAQKTFDQITGIQNGTIPLTASEQAQVDGLKQQFQKFIDDQNLTNTNASGVANIRGYQKGAAEYDPNFQIKTIGSIVSAGAAKIQDINIKMASAVAALEQGFKDNDIKSIQAANDTYQSAAKDRLAQINKTSDAMAQAAKDAAAAKKDEQDKLTAAINGIKTDAAKNGAPLSVIQALSGAGSVDEALAAAGGYMQTATGTLGDYLQYTRDAKANGITPTDYTTFKAQQDAAASALKVKEAYGTAFATASGKAAGEAQSAGAAITSPVTSPDGVIYNPPASIAPYVNFASNGVKYADMSNFAGTPTEKNDAINAAQAAGYKVITNKAVASDVQNISDAMAKLQLIRDAFNPIAADNAASRDTYRAALNNLEAFAQTNPDAAAIGVFQDSALDILKAMSGSQGFRGGQSIIDAVKATFPQITDTKATAEQKIKNMENLIKVRETALVGKPAPAEQQIIDEKSAQNTVKTYLTANPAKAPEVSSRISALEAQAGRPITSQEFLQAFPEYAQTTQAPAQNSNMIGGFNLSGNSF